MVNVLFGADEFRDSSNNLIGPIGFAINADWEVIDRQVVTAAVASVDFKAFDETLYDEYEISILDATVTADGANVGIRTSTDSGATFDSGASDYAYVQRRLSSTTSPFEAQVGDDAHSFMFVITAMGSVAGEVGTVTVRFGPLDGSEIKNSWHHGHGRISDGNEYAYWGGGSRNDTTAVNAFQVIPSSGNLDGGTYVLRARRKITSILQSQDDWVVIDDETGISAVSTHDVFWPDQVYDEIEVVISGLVTGTDARDLLCRLSTDGSTFLSGTDDYEYSCHFTNQQGADSIIDSNTDGTTAIQINVNMGTAANEHCDARVWMGNISNTTRKKTMQYEWSGIMSDADHKRGTGGAIMMDNNDSIRGIQFLMESAATFSADRIRVRGRRLTPTAISKTDWELIERVDVTVAQASLDIFWTGNIYDEVEIAYEIEVATDADELECRVSEDGSTFLSGASDYEFVRNIDQNQGGGSGEVEGNGNDHIELCVNVGDDTNGGATGRVNVQHLGSGFKTKMTGLSTYLDADATQGTVMQRVGGTRAGAGECQGFQLIASSGNIQGVMVARGRRKI